jgi:hypothetical protein
MASGSRARRRLPCPRLYVGRNSLRCQGVAMMQATESSERLNPASVSRFPRDWAPLWPVLGQPQMGSVLVVGSSETCPHNCDRGFSSVDNKLTINHWQELVSPGYHPTS